MKLLISPHSDDFALFVAFTCMGYKPTILTMYASFLQPSRGFVSCSDNIRVVEDIRAAHELGCRIEFAGIPDNLQAPEMEKRTREYLTEFYQGASVEDVWLPAWEPQGHEHHNLCQRVCQEFFDNETGAKVHHYFTYTRNRGKSRGMVEVIPGHGSHIAAKLRALACYTSQLDMTPGIGCWPHFMADLKEYTQPA